MKLTHQDRLDIAEILWRRANDVSTFQKDVTKWTGGTIKEFPGSVELALSRESKRLRSLHDKILSVVPEDIISRWKRAL